MLSTRHKVATFIAVGCLETNKMCIVKWIILMQWTATAGVRATSSMTCNTHILFLLRPTQLQQYPYTLSSGNTKKATPPLFTSFFSSGPQTPSLCHTHSLSYLYNRADDANASPSALEPLANHVVDLKIRCSGAGKLANMVPARKWPALASARRILDYRNRTRIG